MASLKSIMVSMGIRSIEKFLIWIIFFLKNNPQKQSLKSQKVGIYWSLYDGV
jgi:hypothetical protein